jgi:hypothetical protein
MMKWLMVNEEVVCGAIVNCTKIEDLRSLGKLLYEVRCKWENHMRKLLNFKYLHICSVKEVCVFTEEGSLPCGLDDRGLVASRSRVCPLPHVFSMSLGPCTPDAFFLEMH